VPPIGRWEVTVRKPSSIYRTSGVDAISENGSGLGLTRLIRSTDMHAITAQTMKA
jgi:hypothetical protein